MLVHKQTNARPLRLVARVAIDDRPNYRIAADAAMAPNVLGGILTGRLIATPEQRERIATALDATVADLFDDDVAVPE